MHVFIYNGCMFGYIQYGGEKNLKFNNFLNEDMFIYCRMCVSISHALFTDEK